MRRRGVTKTALFPRRGVLFFLSTKQAPPIGRGKIIISLGEGRRDPTHFFLFLSNTPGGGEKESATPWGENVFFPTKPTVAEV